MTRYNVDWKKVTKDMLRWFTMLISSAVSAIIILTPFIIVSKFGGENGVILGLAITVFVEVPLGYYIAMNSEEA